MTFVFYGPAIDEDRLRNLHEFLVPRGWCPDEYSVTDDDGYMADPEGRWEFMESFGSQTFHELDDVTPYPLKCDFEFDGDGAAGVRVQSAGNWNGCTEHNASDILVPDGDDLYERLAATLDTYEAKARAANVRELMECRLFGACGESYNARHKPASGQGAG